jgi:hypothetical protein
MRALIICGIFIGKYNWRNYAGALWKLWLDCNLRFIALVWSEVTISKTWGFSTYIRNCLRELNRLLLPVPGDKIFSLLPSSDFNPTLLTSDLLLLQENHKSTPPPNHHHHHHHLLSLNSLVVSTLPVYSGSLHVGMTITPPPPLQ